MYLRLIAIHNTTRYDDFYVPTTAIALIWYTAEQCSIRSCADWTNALSRSSCLHFTGFSVCNVSYSWSLS